MCLRKVFGNGVEGRHQCEMGVGVWVGVRGGGQEVSFSSQCTNY